MRLATLVFRRGWTGEKTMTRRMVCLLVMAALLPCLASAPASALALGIKVTGAGTGVYPPNTLYNGVRVSGLQIGFGIRVPGNGTARGQLQVTLIGTSPLGMEQDIDVVGQAATGSATAGSTSTFSGLSAVDLGNGTPPLVNVPFTVTIVRNPNGQGTVTLVLGAVTLPVATLNAGSIIIR